MRIVSIEAIGCKVGGILRFRGEERELYEREYNRAVIRLNQFLAEIGTNESMRLPMCLAGWCRTTYRGWRGHHKYNEPAAEAVCFHGRCGVGRQERLSRHRRVFAIPFLPAPWSSPFLHAAYDEG